MCYDGYFIGHQVNSMFTKQFITWDDGLAIYLVTSIKEFSETAMMGVLYPTELKLISVKLYVYHPLCVYGLILFLANCYAVSVSVMSLLLFHMTSNKNTQACITIQCVWAMIWHISRQVPVGSSLYKPRNSLLQDQTKFNVIMVFIFTKQFVSLIQIGSFPGQLRFVTFVVVFIRNCAYIIFVCLDNGLLQVSQSRQEVSDMSHGSQLVKFKFFPGICLSKWFGLVPSQFQLEDSQFNYGGYPL